MLGAFLEFGFAARPVGEAFEFYRSIGFQAVPVGDILDYPYAVVTDGDICIGLHEGEDEGTLLTFVRPDLKDYLRALRRAHIELEFSRLAADEFNEAGFRDPNAQLVTLLEARTFSPGSWEDGDHSVCGSFLEFSLATGSAANTAEFWQRLGLETVGQGEEPHAWTRLHGHGLTLGCYESPPFVAGLTFVADELTARSEYLKAKGLEVRKGAPVSGSHGQSMTLVTPGGGAIYVLDNPPDL